jgi:hypothetical protein
LARGIGSFFFRFVSIPTDPIGQAPDEYQRTVVVRRKLGQADIIVTDDGFVGVIGMNLDDSVRVLNALFATALTWGLPSQVLHDGNRETCDFLEVDANTIHIDAWRGPSARTSLSQERDDDFESWRQYDRQPIDVEKFNQLADRAAQYLAKPQDLDDLLLLAEGWALEFDQNSGRAAFLYGWMVIETVIDRVWEEYVENKLGRKGDDKDNLLNTRNWTTYHHVEVFNQIGVISNDAMAALTKLRKTRNSVAHGAQKPTKEDVRLCVNVAKQIVVNRLDGKPAFEGIRLLSG